MKRDYLNIINNLQMEKDANSKIMAELMKRRIIKVKKEGKPR